MAECLVQSFGGTGGILEGAFENVISAISATHNSGGTIEIKFQVSDLRVEKNYAVVAYFEGDNRTSLAVTGFRLESATSTKNELGAQLGIMYSSQVALSGGSASYGYCNIKSGILTVTMSGNGLSSAINLMGVALEMK